MTRRTSGECFQDLLNFRLQRGNFFFGDFPEDADIYAKIFMNKLIPHASHFLPWNIMILGRDRFWDLLCRLSYYLDAPYYRVQRFFIMSKFIKAHFTNKFINVIY